MKPQQQQQQSQKQCKCIDYDVINGVVQLSNRNLEGRQCKHYALESSDFCALHQNCAQATRQIATNTASGYEHAYAPNEWNHPYLEGSHNCYAYFLNAQIRAVRNKCEDICKKGSQREQCPVKDGDCSSLKPQPGEYYHLFRTGRTDDNDGGEQYTCAAMDRKILADNNALFKVKYGERCPRYYYKGALVVDPKSTYHFYRQNPDGTWSHKPGIMPISNLDSDEKIIYAPHLAGRRYSNDNLNYSEFCNYYCIPNNKYVDIYAI